MSALPQWIETRIDRDLDKTLTQHHVVETMVDAERPFFSTRQLQARVKPDVSAATVRNRLDELQELDVVATEAYPESVTLYYIDHPESEWPLSPEGERALETATPLDRLSMGVRSVSDTVGSPPLAFVGFLCCLALCLVGGVGLVVGFGLVFGRPALADAVGTVLAGGGLSLLSTSAQLGLFFAVVILLDRRLRSRAIR